MAVESVNNNRTALVTAATAAAVGAAAGAGAGYVTSNILEGNAPKDSFIKSLDSVEVTKEKAKATKLQAELKKISESGSLEKISDEAKFLLQSKANAAFKLEDVPTDELKQIAGKLSKGVAVKGVNKETKPVIVEIAKSGSLEGVSDEVKALLHAKASEGRVVDLTKTSANGIKDLAKESLLSEDELKAILKSFEEGSFSGLQKRAAKLEAIKIPEKAEVEDLKKIITNNNKLFGIEKAETGTLSDAVESFVKGQNADELKTLIETTVSKEKAALQKGIGTRKNALTNLFSQFYDVTGKKMKDLPKEASEEFKTGFKSVKNAIRNFKAMSAAKWGAIGAGVVGLTSFITAKVTGKAADKAIAQAQAECECPECNETPEEA